MKKIIVFLNLSLAALALVSCTKEQNSPMEGALDINVQLVGEVGKAVFGGDGREFSFKKGDVITFTPESGTAVSVTLNADAAEPAFSVTIPGLAEHDVNGWFSCNYDDGQISKSQTQSVAGTMDSFPLRSDKVTLKKGVSSVTVVVKFSAAIVEFLPFSESLPGAEVKYAKIGDYTVNLGTAYALPAEKEYGIFVNLPAGTYGCPIYVVGTDRGEFVFQSTATKEWSAGQVNKVSLCLDKATYAYAELDLSGCTISTNAPMLYRTELKNCNNCGFGGSPDWINTISPEKEKRRKAMYGTMANMWDGDNSTCYHTNVDWKYKAEGEWRSHTESDHTLGVGGHHIQVNFPSQYSSIVISVTSPSDSYFKTGYVLQTSSDGTTFTDAATVACAGSGAIGASDVISGTIRAIRIKPDGTSDDATTANNLYPNANSYSEIVWAQIGPAFGIAELKISTKSPVVRATGVSLNKTNLNVTPGEYETLVATVLPEGATFGGVKWSTGDASVATVENGVVTGVAKGSTTITATALDGGYTASCNVTVTEPSPSPYPTGVKVVSNESEHYCYAEIDFKANPKLCFSVCFHDDGATLSQHFDEFTTTHPGKGTPIIMTNADFWFDWDGWRYSEDLVMTGGSMKRYPKFEAGGYYPTRSVLGQNEDGTFEINWARSDDNECTNLYKYPGWPVKYTSLDAAKSAERDWWWPVEACGGGPRLVHNGQRNAIPFYDLECMDFNGGKTEPTSRTAYGLKADGKMVIFVLTDDTGITLEELATYMKNLGCVEALNYDGGGSSEMLGLNKTVLRKQTDETERRIVSAICISEKK